MKTTQKKKKKDVLNKLKNWLIHGKSITHNNAQRMWGTNRLAEYVRRLRVDHGMKIEMKMKSYSDGIYGVYKQVVHKPIGTTLKAKKVNRITTGQYSRI